MLDVIDTLNKLQEFYQSQTPSLPDSLDKDAGALGKALKQIISLGCFRLKAPLQFGGYACGEKCFQQFKEQLVAFSGALAFLQHQHQASIRLMAISNNAELKKSLLPKFIDGSVLAAVGTSQLRKEQACSLKGTVHKEGYQVNGFIPWSSGYRLFEQIIIGFVTEDKQAIYAIIPFSPEVSHGMTVSDPLPLIAGFSTNTVNITLTDYVVSNAKIVLKTPITDFNQNKFVIVNTGSFHCGLGMKAIHYLIQNNLLTSEKIKALVFQIRGEIIKLSHQIINALDNQQFHHAENIRARGIYLTNQVIQLVSALTKGQSCLSEHSINRLYRESLLFNSVSISQGVTDAIIEQYAESVPLCV